MKTNWESRTNCSNYWIFLYFFIRATPQHKITARQEEFKRSARINEEIQWLAACKTQTPSEHDSRHLGNRNSYQNQEIEIVICCVVEHGKKRAPVLGVWTLSKVEIKITFTRHFNTFLRMSHFSRRVFRDLCNFEISFEIKKTIQICEEDFRWPREHL